MPDNSIIPSPSQLFGETPKKSTIPPPDVLFSKKPTPREDPYVKMLNEPNTNINSMVDRLPEMPGDTQSKKQIIKDLIANRGKPEEVTQTIETLRGKHPKQEGGTKYYIDERGVAHPLKNSEKPPEGYHVGSLFGSAADAKDDNVITDIAKTAWNVLPSLAGNVVSLANTGVQLVTGEKSDALKSAENAAEALKFEKDPDIQGSLLKTENIHKFSDLLKGENYDLSPKTLWGTALSLGESIAQFAIPAGAAGKMVKGAEWATKILSTGEKVLSTAGELATAGVASFITNHPEVADAADRAGLKGREAAAWSLATTGFISTLDVKLGLGPKIFRNTAIKEEKDAFLTAMAKKVLEKTEQGELTDKALNEVFKETLASYPKLASTWLKESSKDAFKEGLQESGQEAIKGLSQEFWDGVTDEDKAKFNVDITSPQSVANLLNQFAAGAMGGAPTALAFNKIKQIQKENNQSKTVFGVVQKGDEAVKNFKNNVYAAKENGELTDEQAQDAITRVNAYKEYNDITGSLNLKEEKKRESFDLTFQKQNLESQIEAMGDPKKLNPLEQAQYSGLEKQAADIQKRINEIVTEAQVKDEKVVTEKTIKDVEKQNEQPKEKEGEKKTNLSPEMQAMVDKYKGVAKPKDERKFEDVPVEEYNKLTFESRKKHAVTVEHLESHPDSRIEDNVVTERSFPSKNNNNVFEVQMPTGHVIRFSSSMIRDDKNGRGNLMFLRPKSLMKQDKNGVWEVDDNKLKGAKVGLKAYTINNDGREKKVIKIFSTENNEDYGKFIGWAKETHQGKNDYTHEEINGKGGLIDIEHTIEKPLTGESSSTSTPTSPTEGGETTLNKFDKSVNLFYKIKNTEGASKKRSLTLERKKLLEENPSIKYIDDNINSIFDQLEEKGQITKNGLCP